MCTKTNPSIFLPTGDIFFFLFFSLLGSIRRTNENPIIPVGKLLVNVDYSFSLALYDILLGPADFIVPTKIWTKMFETSSSSVPFPGPSPGSILFIPQHRILLHWIITLSLRTLLSLNSYQTYIVNKDYNSNTQLSHVVIYGMKRQREERRKLTWIENFLPLNFKCRRV